MVRPVARVRVDRLINIVRKVTERSEPPRAWP
jgi:hypothetical protein